MTIARVIRKNLAGEDDLLLGKGVVTQTRNGVNYNITKNDLIKPVDSIAELNLVDVTKFTRAVLYENSKVTNYQYNAGTGLWGIIAQANTPWSFDALSLAKAGTFALGDSVYVTDTGANYIVEALGTPDGYGDHATDDGNFQLTLQSSGAVNVKHFGATGDGATNDQPACQAALNHITATSLGGSMYFPIGNFVFQSPVSYDAGSVDTSLSIEIYGSGPSTVITQDYEATSEEEGLFEFKADEVAGINLRRIHVHHLKFNANLHRGSAIFGRILTACQFTHIWAGGNANDAQATHASIYLKNCAQTLVSDCVLNHNPNTGGANGGASIRLKATAYATGLDSFRSKNIISDNIIGEQVRTGIEIESEVSAADGGNIVSGNSIFLTFANAINLINTDGNTITGNMIDGASRANGAVGILLDSSSFNVITDNVLFNAGVNFVKLDGQLTVAEDCTANIISNNIMKTSEASLSSAVNISDANCVSTIVKDNVFTGTFAGATITDIGTASRIEDQYGYAVAASLSGSGTAGAAHTTPSVAGINSINLLTSIAYTSFDGGEDGQLLFVRGASGTTIVNSGTLRLAGGADVVTADSNTTLLFLYFGSAWWEISRNYGTAQNKGTAVPTVGSHTKGELLWDSNATSGGTVGWVCVTAGTPGTWKTFGAITA